MHGNSTRAAFLFSDPCGGVLEVKDALGPPFGAGWSARLIAARFARSARIAVPNSNFIAERLFSAGFPRERAVTIRNGIDLDRFRPQSFGERRFVRLGEGWKEDWFVVTCVGRLTNWKGQHIAIQALPELRAAIPSIRLVLIGDSGFDPDGYARSLRHLAISLGVNDIVIEAGYRDDVSRLIGASDALLHTSLLPEPLGLTPMEAQAMGVPVVAARAGGVLETVVHRESGYLYSSGDSAELIAGVLWVRAHGADPLLRQSLRLRAEENFDMEAALDSYQRLYQALDPARRRRSNQI